MKEREVQSEALRKKVEQRLMEVDVIMEAIKEKNELIESANNDLVERNNYLEDRMANQRKDHGVVYEENCYLKTKMMESEKAKRDKDGNMLDLSGSQDMNLMIHEDFQRLQDDNIRLGEEVEMLRKRLFTLNEDNKNLNSHVRIYDTE
jgi:hypothetical protein